MASPLDSGRLLRESAPVAAILLFWLVPAAVVQPVVANGLVRAGVVMALLYTVVRGVDLARHAPSTPAPETVEELVRENLRVAIPAAAWFALASAVYFVAHVWTLLGIPGAFTSPADGLAYVFTGAGVAVVLLYAIVVGITRVSNPERGPGPGPATRSPVDD